MAVRFGRPGPCGGYSRKAVRVNRVRARPLLQFFERSADVFKDGSVDEFDRSNRSHHRERCGNAVDDLAKCEFVLHRPPSHLPRCPEWLVYAHASRTAARAVVAAPHPSFVPPPISTAPEPSMVPIVIYLAAMVAITLALLFVILDLTGGSPTHH